MPLSGLSGEQLLRLGFLAAAAIVFVFNLHAFFGWTERSGVTDEICYQRQAHLFQRFGLAGIDTDIRWDDDGFFARARQSIGVDPKTDLGFLCHPVSKLGKHVIQYPPGTGFIMAAFPEGSQAAWLYTVCMTVVMGGVIFIISIASIRASIIAAGLFGLCALYLMVNPTKASYSMAPTTAACIVAAIFSPLMFQLRRLQGRIIAAVIVGFLLGLSVSFRTANLLLVAGYVVVLSIVFLRNRDGSTFWLGAFFALAYCVGLSPSLIANYVNAGSLFSTTYGGQDAAPPDLTFSAAAEYLTNMQGHLAIVAVLGTIWMMRTSRHLAPLLIVATNLAVNLGFFFSHTVTQSYYLMPILTLALWALLAQWLLEHRYSAWFEPS